MKTPNRREKRRTGKIGSCMLRVSPKESEKELNDDDNNVAVNTRCIVNWY